MDFLMVKFVPNFHKSLLSFFLDFLFLFSQVHILEISTWVPIDMGFFIYYPPHHLTDGTTLHDQFNIVEYISYGHFLNF